MEKEEIFYAVVIFLFAIMISLFSYDEGNHKGYAEGHKDAVEYLVGKQNAEEISKCLRQDGKPVVQLNKVLCVKEKF